LAGTRVPVQAREDQGAPEEPRSVKVRSEGACGAKSRAHWALTGFSLTGVFVFSQTLRVRCFDVGVRHVEVEMLPRHGGTLADRRSHSRRDLDVVDRSASSRDTRAAFSRCGSTST